MNTTQLKQEDITKMLPGRVNISLNKSQSNATQKPSIFKKEETDNRTTDDKITSRKDSVTVKVIEKTQ